MSIGWPNFQHERTDNRVDEVRMQRAWIYEFLKARQELRHWEAEYKSKYFNGCGLTLLRMNQNEFRDTFGNNTAGDALYYRLVKLKGKKRAEAKKCAEQTSDKDICGENSLI
jgi:hypothetical protein